MDGSWSLLRIRRQYPVSRKSSSKREDPWGCSKPLDGTGCDQMLLDQRSLTMRMGSPTAGSSAVPRNT
eukprot:10121816-Lingulodinium_polyedra.AAC.1